ncbi:MAG: hypothetical protein A2X64_01205 [Ignavibacteria bacterium GWF2_33_9]|nr:MAG: hypothetical protein A2X64_01205 [Ignavibacteria bacterium GWF2_33_9]
MKFKLIIILLFVANTFIVFAQDNIVKDYLNQYSQGKMDEVRKALPDLLVEYPADPGVKLLLGIVLEDANKAQELFKEIIQKTPESEWADDAYWRLIQFYAIKNDADKVEFELNNFRKRYPTSEYLIPATDVARTCRSLENQKLKNEEKLKESVENTESKDVNTKKPEKNEMPINSGNYGLQVAAFDTKAAAENAREEFSEKRLRTSIEEKTVEGKKKYVVVIGNYSTMEAAEAAKNIIMQQCNCSPIIYKK